MDSNVKISYCYFFNCIHNENGVCLKNPIKIGYNGACMYKSIAKME